MSGIFGYIGKGDCRSALLKGVAMLEHRGGDSTGIALKINDELVCIKDIGKASRIEERVGEISVDCSIGIAQVDCASRQRASILTATPACNNLFAIALDGRVDNYDYLKDYSGNPFPICTDADAVLAMLCVENISNKTDLIIKMDAKLKGEPTYAFFASDENAIYCKKGRAPLFVGIAKDGYYISSEIAPLCEVSVRYFSLNDGEFLRLSKERATVFDSKKKRIKRNPLPLPKPSATPKASVLIDEIFYCPLTIKTVYKSFVTGDSLTIPNLKISRHGIDRLARIIITGAGESYSSARLGAYYFGMLCDVPVYCMPSGELANYPFTFDNKTLVIAVSNSGENPATIAVAKRAKSAGARTIALTQCASSYLAQITDTCICTGYDLPNDSIMGFISAYQSLAFLALYFGNRSGVVDELYLSVALKMAESLSGKVSSAVKSVPQLERSADLISDARRIITTGYLGDYALAMEAGDKLRKIAGIDSVAVQLDELEQMLGLSAEYTLIVAFISDDRCLQTTLSYLRRARCLGASVLIYTASAIEEEIRDFDSIVSINDTIPLFNPVPIICSFYKSAIIASENAGALPLQQNA